MAATDRAVENERETNAKMSCPFFHATQKGQVSSLYQDAVSVYPSQYILAVWSWQGQMPKAEVANLLEIGNRYLTPPICHGVY